MALLIEQVAAFCGGIRAAEMPPADVDAIKLVVLDTIGCALGAVGCAPHAMLLPLLAPAPDAAAATLWGTRVSSDLAGAILANGTLVRYLDFMDVYWAREICHPSENIPVALACAQAAGCSGARLIEAIAAAYEVQVRLADAFAFESLALHHVSAAGFVAPLVMAMLWQLDADRAAHAAALGGFRHLTHATLVRGNLSMAKAIGYAAAASDCVQSTRLAAAGFTGPLAILEGLGVRDLDLSPGSAAVQRVSLKQFPVQYALQAPVEAALALRERLAGDWRGVVELVVEVLPDAVRRTADPAKFDPSTRETADHSLPCCVAMALVDGCLEKRQFDEGRWRAADVRGLIGRMRVVASAELERAWPGGRPARVTARLHDGTACEVLVPVPLGDRSRPLPRAAIEAKFLRLARPVLGAAQAGRVMEMVQALERQDGMRALCEALAPEA